MDQILNPLMSWWVFLGLPSAILDLPVGRNNQVWSRDSPWITKTFNHRGKSGVYRFPVRNKGQRLAKILSILGAMETWGEKAQADHTARLIFCGPESLIIFSIYYTWCWFQTTKWTPFGSCTEMGGCRRVKQSGNQKSSLLVFEVMSPSLPPAQTWRKCWNSLRKEI
jgi:hypothetical protein